MNMSYRKNLINLTVRLRSCSWRLTAVISTVIIFSINVFTSENRIIIPPPPSEIITPISVGFLDIEGIVSNTGEAFGGPFPVTGVGLSLWWDPIGTFGYNEEYSTSEKGYWFSENGLVSLDIGDMDAGEEVPFNLRLDIKDEGLVTIYYKLTQNEFNPGDLTGDTEGSFEIDITFEEDPLFTLCGQKFMDIAGNGIQDPGDPGWNGVTIELLDEAGNLIATTETRGIDLDGDGAIDPYTEAGRFCFEGLPPGVYIVREVVPEGFEQTAPPDPGTFTVELATGTQPLIRFGNTPIDTDPFKLCGEKFLDINGDGVRDPFEPGLNGVTIELLDETGAVIVSTITRRIKVEEGDGNPFEERGRFCFEDLTPGVYTVREIVPIGWLQTMPPDPGSYTIDFPLPPKARILFGNEPDFDLNLEDHLIDFGDLPAPYPTLLAEGGPWHVIDDEGPRLGVLIDAEPDGQPHEFALGDDLNDLPDEDGLISYSILNDGSVRFEIFATVPSGSSAFLDAWVDLNNDGVLETFEADGMPHPEYVFVGEPVLNGLNILTSAPGIADQALGITFSRLRISSLGVSLPKFGAPDGEVEDYYLGVDIDLFNGNGSGLFFDFGDAPEVGIPDLDIPYGYPTRLENDGARHLGVFNVRLGDLIDVERDGQPHIYAEGDDMGNLNDEDGIRFEDGFNLVSMPDPVYGGTMERYTVEAGTSVTFTPLASVRGYLSVWIDWNRDGDWDDPGEKVFDNELIDGPPDYTQLTFEVPADANPGFTFARFRFSRIAVLDEPTGPAPDGEVEDYMLLINPTTTNTEMPPNLPGTFRIFPNYPNPFNPSTNIRFDLPEATHINLTIYDVLGRMVATLVNEIMPAGSHTIIWDAENLPSGMYIYRLSNGSEVLIGTAILQK